MHHSTRDRGTSAPMKGNAMENLNESLLYSWLTVSSVVNNERLASSTPFNEAHVCYLLHRQYISDPKTYLTATELCAQTRMLKSQMNKVLTSLEKQELIERFPSPDDKRKAFIRIVESKIERFEAIHARCLEIANYVSEKLGPEDTAVATRLFLRISDIIDQTLVIGGERGHNI